MIGNPLVLTYFNYTLEDAIDILAELGCDALEVCPPDVKMCKTDAMRRQFADYCAAKGLPMVRYQLGLPSFFFDPLEPGWGGVSNPAPSEAAPAPSDSPAPSEAAIVESYKKEIDIAASFGANQMMTWEGRKSNAWSSGDVHGWVLDSTLKIFKPVVDYAKSRNISLSVEVHPFSVGADLDFLVKLCDSLDPDYFGVAYDCAHFAVAMPDGYIDAIYKLGKRIKHLHFCDSDKVTSEMHFPVGKGCLDLDAMVRALKEVGFSGTVMADTWLYPLQREAISSCVDFLREAFPRKD